MHSKILPMYQEIVIIISFICLQSHYFILNPFSQWNLSYITRQNNTYIYDCE